MDISSTWWKPSHEIFQGNYAFNVLDIYIADQYRFDMEIAL